MENGDAEGATGMGYCIWQTQKCLMGTGLPTRSTALAYIIGKMEKLTSRGIRMMFDWNPCGGRKIDDVPISWTYPPLGRNNFRWFVQPTL